MCSVPNFLEKIFFIINEFKMLEDKFVNLSQLEISFTISSEIAMNFIQKLPAI
jgi:hypothetical protein